MTTKQLRNCKYWAASKSAEALLLLFFVLGMAPNAYSQENSVKTEILNYKDSVADVVSNGRKLLTEKFVAGDMDKVKQIKDYLLAHVTNDDYIVFYPLEYTLILYWTQDYRQLEEYLIKWDSIKRPLQKRIRPQNDLLYSKISAKTVTSKTQLLSSVATSALPAVDKDFLRLNLEYAVFSIDGLTFAKRDTLNKLADEFLSRHPKSAYEDYIRRYIRNQYALSDWGLGFEFFSGFGFFTGSLADNFSNSVPIGVAFDIQYKKWILYLRDFIGFSGTRKDIPFAGGIWPAGSQALVFLPEASLGYEVTNGKRVKVAPFAGITWTDVAPSGYDQTQQPKLKDADVSALTYTLGANCDIKLHKRKASARRGSEESFAVLRFRYGYNIPQFSASDGVTGNFHYITVGFGGFGRKMKRQK